MFKRWRLLWRALSGRPTLESGMDEELRFHLTLHIAAMGVARVLAFPEIVTYRLPDCAEAEGPYDPMFEIDPTGAPRNVLHVYTVFLKLWRREDFGAALDRLLVGSG